jgi:hypothetical protein
MGANDMKGSNEMRVATEEHFASLLCEVHMRPVRCSTCQRLLMKVGKDFSGTIQVKCRGCKSINIIAQ